MHAGEDQEPSVWSELTTFQSFKSAYDDEDSLPNITDEWLDPAAMISRMHEIDQRKPKISVQDEEWPHEPG